MRCMINLSNGLCWLGFLHRGHRFYLEQSKLVSAKANCFAAFFLMGKASVSQKTLHVFFFSFCLFLYIFLFKPLWVHVALYLFCLPAYGRRKCASVTDRKLFGPGNLSVLVGVGGRGPCSLPSQLPCVAWQLWNVCVWNVLFSAWLNYWSMYTDASCA